MVTLYCIVNLVNGKRYFGKTEKSFLDRCFKHALSAKYGRGYYLGAAIRKYGLENFVAFPVGWTAGNGNSEEQKLIAEYRTYLAAHGYNLTLGGEGQRANAATRRKLSIVQTGKKRTAEHRANLSKALMGHRGIPVVFTKEVRERQTAGLLAHYQRKRLAKIVGSC